MAVHNRLLGWMHRLAGSAAAGRHVAVKIRNQCNMVIAGGLADGADFSTNGERLLLQAVAARSTCFVDVGANKGFWAAEYVRFAGDGCRGLLFEPNPLVLDELRARAATLGANLEVIDIALSDAPGVRAFSAETDGGERSSFSSEWAQPGAVTVSVRTSTFDVEIERRGIGHIDFLKIDTEGFDFHVLRGAAKKLADQEIGIVQFEYNAPWSFAGDTLHACRQFLAGCGYELFLLKRRGLYRVEWQKYGEYFAYSNLVAASGRAQPQLAQLVIGSL